MQRLAAHYWRLKMATIDPTPEQLHAHITGDPLPRSMSMYASSADYWKAQAEANAKDAERWRYVQHGFSAMSLNIDGMHYWTWRGSSLLGRGPSIAAAVDAGMAEAPAVGAA